MSWDPIQCEEMHCAECACYSNDPSVIQAGYGNIATQQQIYVFHVNLDDDFRFRGDNNKTLLKYL